jgi:nucleoside-diphosphate-sugar epimerase
MKILVLGSEGQIGKPTCDYLEEMGHEVIRYDKIRSPYEDLTGNFSNLMKSVSESDFVYYFASNVGGAKYLEKHQDSVYFISDNMTIMRNVFTMLQWTGKPFIFTSSQMAELSYSTYGLLKLLGERMTNSAGGLVVRLWNVYGPEHDEEKSHVITDFCKMAKQDGVIKMRTNGTESRQLLYARDCAECFLTLTENYDTLDKTKNYNITNFEWVTIMDVAKTIQEISGCEVIPGDGKDLTQMNAMNEPDPYILNLWKPKTSLKEGITQIYNDTY